MREPEGVSFIWVEVSQGLHVTGIDVNITADNIITDYVTLIKAEKEEILTAIP